MTLAEPVSVNQWLGLQRWDYIAPSGSQQIGLRFAASNLSRPDFVWSPYADYDSALNQPVYSVAANWTKTIRPALNNHLTAGWNYERLSWGRAYPEVPMLMVTPQNDGTIPLLPGSPAAYAFNNSNRSLELNDSAMIVKGRHIVKFGGGGFYRHVDDFLGYGLDGDYSFSSLLEFALDQPSTFTTALSRQAPNFVQPNPNRQYQSWQFFGFVEDTFRITSRLVANFGLRYDDFGPPSSVGPAKDWVFEFGTGTSFPERIADASLQPPTVSGSNVFTSNHQDFAPRIGFAYDVSRTGDVVLHGGFGVFYDRLFDNLWLNARNNSFVMPSPFNVTNTNYLAGVSAVLPSYAGTNFVSNFPNLTAFQPGISNGYAEDFFIGIQSRPAPEWSFEVNGAASLGRKLIATDILNRNSDVNPNLPPIDYLSSQGLSDYYSLNLVTRWRHKNGFLQAAYTWSHAIDLQSDPIAGDFFNLLFVNIGPAPATGVKAAFSNPYDSRGDRGNADFDQRHDLVFYSFWRAPSNGSSFVRRMLRDFTFSQIAAIRSGFPYSIYTVASTLDEINPRAHVIGLSAPVPALGGKQLFDASDFCPTAACAYGESGRNAFAGPGLFNLDLAVSRAFRAAFLGEGGVVTLRADFFNALNHANLNPPDNQPNTPGFGISLYGQPAASAGFPALIPLAETSRQVQLHVRISF